MHRTRHSTIKSKRKRRDGDDVLPSRKKNLFRSRLPYKVKSVLSFLTNLEWTDALWVVETTLDSASQVSLSRVCKYFESRLNDRIFNASSADESHRIRVNQKSWFVYNCITYGYGNLIRWFHDYCYVDYETRLDCPRECKKYMVNCWDLLFSYSCNVRPSSADVTAAILEKKPARLHSNAYYNAISSFSYENDDPNYVFWMIEKIVLDYNGTDEGAYNITDYLVKSISGGSMIGRNLGVYHHLVRNNHRLNYTISLLRTFKTLVIEGRYEEMRELLQFSRNGKGPKYNGDQHVHGTSGAIITAMMNNVVKTKMTLLYDSAKSGDLRTFVFCATLYYSIADDALQHGILPTGRESHAEKVCKGNFPFLEPMMEMGHSNLIEYMLDVPEISVNFRRRDVIEPSLDAVNIIREARSLGIRARMTDKEDSDCVYYKGTETFKYVCSRAKKTMHELILESNDLSTQHQWMINKLETALEMGKFDIVRVLHIAGLNLFRRCDKRDCNCPDRNGRLDYRVHWEMDMWDWIKYVAAYCGNLPFLEWMHSVQPLEKNDAYFLSWAVNSGDLELLDWAVKEGIVFLPKIEVDKNAAGGELNAVPIFYEEREKEEKVEGWTKSKAADYDSPLGEPKGFNNEEFRSSMEQYAPKNPYSALLYNGISSKPPEERDGRTVEIFEWLRTHGFRPNLFNMWYPVETDDGRVNYWKSYFNLYDQGFYTPCATKCKSIIYAEGLWGTMLWLLKHYEKFFDKYLLLRFYKHCYNPRISELLLDKIRTMHGKSLDEEALSDIASHKNCVKLEDMFDKVRKYKGHTRGARRFGDAK